MNRILPTVSPLCLAIMLLPVDASAASNQASLIGYPGGHQQALGPLYGAARKADLQPAALGAPASELRRWNRIAIDASGLDHTPVAAGETRVFGEQFPSDAAQRMGCAGR
jgi:hypothetical protein